MPKPRLRTKPPKTPDTSPAWYFGSILMVSLLSLICRIVMPPNIILFSPHDDQLAVIGSNSILRGEWLGPWSVTTLLKSPLYSIFLAVSKLIGLSPVIFTHVLLLGIQFLISGAIIRLLKVKNNYIHTVKFFTYAFLSLNPLLFTSDFSRIYRISLTTLLVLIIFLIGLKIILAIYYDNLNLFSKRLKFLHSAFGLTTGLALITREDSIPFAVTITILVLSAFFYKLIKYHLPLRKATFTKSLMTPALCLALMALPFISVSLANEFKYDYFGVNDYSRGYFSKAMTAWANVDNGRDNRNGVLISEGQRQAVFQISPSARLLEKGLSFEPGQGWKGPMCQTTGICDEFGAAWIPFAIRDAAVSATGLTSENEFQGFFKQIFGDISTACNSGRLTCRNFSSSTGLLTLRQGIKSGMLNYSFEFGNSFLKPLQTNNFEVFQNQNDNAEIIATWKSGTGLQPSDPSGSSIYHQLRIFLKFLSWIYSFVIPVLFLLTLVSLASNILQKKHAVVIFIQAGLLFSLFLFISLYGLISASWGFLAGASLYASVAQPLFLIFILTGSIGFLKKIRD